MEEASFLHGMTKSFSYMGHQLIFPSFGIGSSLNIQTPNTFILFQTMKYFQYESLYQSLNPSIKQKSEQHGEKQITTLFCFNLSYDFITLSLKIICSLHFGLQNIQYFLHPDRK